MIQITIQSEEYYQTPAPEVTEEMIDWVLLTLYKSVKNRQTQPRSVRSLNIRINQSYIGSTKFHFYISFNDAQEFHRSAYEHQFISDIQYLRSVEYPVEAIYKQVESFRVLDESLPERCTWVLDFVDGGIDMGQDGIDAKAQFEYNRRLSKKLDNLVKHKRSQSLLYSGAITVLSKFNQEIKDVMLSEVDTFDLSEDQYHHWFENSRIINKTRFGLCTI